MKQHHVALLSLLLIISFNPPVLAQDADADYCARLLTRLSQQALERKVECVGCETQLREAITRLPFDELVVAVSWANPNRIGAPGVEAISKLARQSGVDVYTDLSLEGRYSHRSWKSGGYLTTVVFRGVKEKLLSLISQTPSEFGVLANYNILNVLAYPFLTEPQIVHPRNYEERIGIIRGGIKRAQERLVLVNDVPTKTFVAFVDLQTFADFVYETESKTPVYNASEERLFREWDELALKVQWRDYFLIVTDNEGNQAAMVNLPALAEIQTFRLEDKTVFRRVSQRWRDIPRPNIVLEEKVAPTAAPPPAAVEIEHQKAYLKFSDVLLRPGRMFNSEDGVALNSKQVGIAVLFKKVPRFVVFDPEFLRSATIDKVETKYREIGEIPIGVAVPGNVRRFFNRFQTHEKNLGHATPVYTFTELTGSLGTLKYRESFTEMRPFLIKEPRLVFVPVPELAPESSVGKTPKQKMEVKKKSIRPK